MSQCSSKVEDIRYRFEKPVKNLLDSNVKKKKNRYSRAIGDLLTDVWCRQKQYVRRERLNYCKLEPSVSVLGGRGISTGSLRMGRI